MEDALKLNKLKLETTPYFDNIYPPCNLHHLPVVTNRHLSNQKEGPKKLQWT